MKFDKGRFNKLIGYWIKCDGKLWVILTKKQLKLLFDRLVLEMTYQQLARAEQMAPDKIKENLTAIYTKIERSHGKDIASLARDINTGIEAREAGRPEREPVLFEMHRIFLN